MNKAELIRKLAIITGEGKGTVAKIVNELFDTVSKQLSSGGEVQIVGFGVFVARWIKARSVVDVRDSSKQVNVQAVRVPRFKPGTKLKKMLKTSA